MANVKFSDLSKDTQLGDNDLILKSTVEDGWSTISGADLKTMFYPKEMREKSLSSSDDLNQLFEKPDVIIDFSVPKATLFIINYAKENNIKNVIATTGFKKYEENIINDYSKYIPIFKIL